MKKIFCIIVLFISVVLSGAAQTTVGGIQDNFKKGYFLLMDDEFYIMFKAADEMWSTEDGSACGAVFETVIMSDDQKKGEEWFKEKMKTEDGQEVMWTMFNKSYGITLGDDYTVTEEGRARVSMTLMK